ncbi:MAG: hypothetical protein KDC44_17905, partial [Phaeodactylibacter sp.]|nr:hypothetical protein [Phaeodactylibacter sp.]
MTTLTPENTMLLLMICCWSTLFGSPCDRPDLYAAYRQLSETIDATQPVRALELADSISTIFQEEGLERCELQL